MCDVHPDAGVEGAGAPGYEANAGVSRQLAVCFGHVGSARFVTARHKADALGIIKSVQDLKVALTGDAERRVDAVRFQRVDKNPTTGSCM